MQPDIDPNEHLIGWAVLGMPTGCTHLSLVLLENAMTAHLKRKSLQWTPKGSTYCSLFCLHFIGVSSRGAALSLVKSGLQELGVFEFSVIGYWDPEEIIWRTIYPGGGNFGWFMEQPQIEAARAENEKLKGSLQAFADQLSAIRRGARE